MHKLVKWFLVMWQVHHKRVTFSHQNLFFLYMASSLPQAHYLAPCSLSTSLGHCRYRVLPAEGSPCNGTLSFEGTDIVSV